VLLLLLLLGKLVPWLRGDDDGLDKEKEKEEEEDVHVSLLALLSHCGSVSSAVVCASSFAAVEYRTADNSAPR